MYSLIEDEGDTRLLSLSKSKHTHSFKQSHGHVYTQAMLTQSHTSVNRIVTASLLCCRSLCCQHLRCR